MAKLEAKQDPARAEASYRRAVELAPKDWIPRQEFAVFLTTKARYGEASQWMEECAKLVPDSARVWQNLGALYHFLDRYEEAVSALQRALEIDPNARTWSNVGTARFFQGKYAEAAVTFEKAVELDPNHYLNWGNWGDALRWTPGNQERARSAFRHAIELLDERIRRSPEDQDLLGRKVLYLAKLGSPDARQGLQTLLERKDLSAANYFRLAIVQELSGNRPHALGALREALRRRYPAKEIRSEPELAALRNDFAYHRLLNEAPPPSVP